MNIPTQVQAKARELEYPDFRRWVFDTYGADGMVNMVVDNLPKETRHGRNLTRWLYDTCRGE